MTAGSEASGSASVTRLPVRPLTALALLLAFAVSLAGPVSAAQGTPPAPGDTGPVYLALGDSIAVGDGASDPERTAYVPLVHAALQDSDLCRGEEDRSCAGLRLLNLAEGFATTATLLDSQLPAALETIERRNADDDPGNDIVAITIDIGGFDAFARLFRECVAEVSPACSQAIRETLPLVGRNLAATLTRLRVAAGPDTRIAVMTYFNSLLACTLQGAADTAELILEGAPGITPGLNGVIRQAAARADVLVADTFGKLGAGDLAGGIDCLHPNDAGHAKIARAFVSVLAPAAALADGEGMHPAHWVRASYPASPGYRSRCSRFMRR